MWLIIIESNVIRNTCKVSIEISLKTSHARSSHQIIVFLLVQKSKIYCRNYNTTAKTLLMGRKDMIVFIGSKSYTKRSKGQSAAKNFFCFVLDKSKSVVEMVLN